MIALALVATVLCNPDTIRISPGSQEVVHVPGVTKVAIPGNDIADVRVTGKDELLVLGRQKGRTTLTLWANGHVQNRTIVVDDGKGSDIARLVKDQVNPTLQVSTFNDRVVIDGVVDSVSELERLKTLVGDDPNVKIMVRLNPRVMPFIAEQITEALHKAGLLNAHATAIGQKIFLEGSVTDEIERQKAQQIADAYYAGAGFL